MDISVILTGGTIGSEVDSSGWIGTKETALYAVIEQYKTKYPEEAAKFTFQTAEPYRILSENLNGQYLSRLAACVSSVLPSGTGVHPTKATNSPDAIIICHGSDTLVYSAAMLSRLVYDAEIPIVLISSNHPLSDPSANGVDNFRFALDFIFKLYTDGNPAKRFSGTPSVYAANKNTDGQTYIHAGDRLLLQSAYAEDIFSVANTYVAVYDSNGNYRENTLNGEQSAYLTEKQPLRKGKNNPYEIKDNSEGILFIRSNPGLIWPSLSAHSKIRAVLIETYHSGTTLTNRHFCRMMAEARENRIPVYVVGAKSADFGYETIRAYKEQGVEVLANVTPIAAYCDLWYNIL